ncbi:MAG: tetratricopeptide repeat protein [Methylocystis sp.]|nr:tetratricopeptide repeat protein [Alphaproteobacteria bacterium]
MADTSPTPPAQEIIETTESRFRQDVLEESLRKLVIVNIWSETQAACKEVKSHLERLIDAAQGKVRLAHLNIASGRSIVDQLGITSAPAVIAFQRGRPVDGFVGALPFDQIKGFLERLLGPIEDNADLLNAAQEMVTQGDIAGAHALLAELTSKEPLDPKAFAILARLYVEAQQIESAKALLERLPESLHKDADVASVLAAIANAERAADLGQTHELQRKIQQDPNNFQAYFDLALALNAENKRDEAAQALLEIIRRDRNWQDDGARKQLVQFFEAWGPMDSAAVQARRKLSGLLFS